jgi:hypothetical protein
VELETLGDLVIEIRPDNVSEPRPGGRPTCVFDADAAQNQDRLLRVLQVSPSVPRLVEIEEVHPVVVAILSVELEVL